MGASPQTPGLKRVSKIGVVSCWGGKNKMLFHNNDVYLLDIDWLSRPAKSRSGGCSRARAGGRAAGLTRASETMNDVPLPGLERALEGGRGMAELGGGQASLSC